MPFKKFSDLWESLSSASRDEDLLPPGLRGGQARSVGTFVSPKHPSITDCQDNVSPGPGSGVFSPSSSPAKPTGHKGNTRDPQTLCIPNFPPPRLRQCVYLWGYAMKHKLVYWIMTSIKNLYLNLDAKPSRTALPPTTHAQKG